MVKSKRKKRKTKPSAEWKKLRQQHMKGPKRVKIRDPRQKKGVDPLLVPANIKKIQIWYSKTCRDKVPISVVVFNRAFEQMGLYKGKSVSMRRDCLKSSGRALEKTLDLFNHNNRLTGAWFKKRLEGTVGRCLVFSKAFECVPDATLHIRPTREEEERTRKTSEHIDALFSQDAPKPARTVAVEYM